MDNENCPGYFGHIKLAKPVYHIGFVRTVLRVLACVSYRNSKLLVEAVRISRISFSEFKKRNLHSECGNLKCASELTQMDYITI